MLVIATRPGRTVRRSKNNVQKFAQVQPNGKFKWVTDVNEATTFTSASAMVYAIGKRAQELDKDPTHDVTFAEVQRSGVTVQRIANGA